MALLGALLTACQPTVRLEAPRDPIVINLNVKIEQEVRVRVEQDIEELLQEEEELF
ncbi:MAG TPA: YnbE family lipoprotein [Geminicoccaceae bacterium]|nr:YnbE family lipoprotein [Geminicoccaceae bacterium]